MGIARGIRFIFCYGAGNEDRRAILGLNAAAVRLVAEQLDIGEHVVAIEADAPAGVGYE